VRLFHVSALKSWRIKCDLHAKKVDHASQVHMSGIIYGTPFIHLVSLYYNITPTARIDRIILCADCTSNVIPLASNEALGFSHHR
jgi:hypothetical protein